MNYSVTENLAERYFRLTGWLVEKNVPILTGLNNYWSDLDLIAVKEKVLLINCKDYLQSTNDIQKEIDNLKAAETFIKSKYPHLNNKAYKKLYIYDYTPKDAIKILNDNNIETIQIKTIYVKYLKEIDLLVSSLNAKRNLIAKGKRYYYIGQFNDLDKMMIYMLNNNLLNEKHINEILKSTNIPELSEIK